MKEKRFFVLPYSLHGEHIRHLMGRMVLDPLNPLKRFIPDPSEENGFNPSEIVPNILQSPISYTSRSDIIRLASSAKLRARLSAYLGLETSLSSSNSVQLGGEEVKRYEMSNHKTVFQKFMGEERYAKLIVGLLEESKKGEVLMVVGFYTTKRTRWATSQTREWRDGVDFLPVFKAHFTKCIRHFQVPVSEIIGLPPGLPLDLNPGVSIEGARGREHEMTGQVDEEEVFAIAYDVVKNKHSFDKSAKGWVSKTPVLGDEKRVQASHLGMAGGGSDEELEFEDEDVADDGTADFVLDLDAMPDLDGAVEYLEAR